MKRSISALILALFISGQVFAAQALVVPMHVAVGKNAAASVNTQQYTECQVQIWSATTSSAVVTVYVESDPSGPAILVGTVTNPDATGTILRGPCGSTLIVSIGTWASGSLSATAVLK